MKGSILIISDHSVSPGVLTLGPRTVHHFARSARRPTSGTVHLDALHLSHRVLTTGHADEIKWDQGNEVQEKPRLPRRRSVSRCGAGTARKARCGLDQARRRRWAQIKPMVQRSGVGELLVIDVYFTVGTGAYPRICPHGTPTGCCFFSFIFGALVFGGHSGDHALYKCISTTRILWHEVQP